MAYILKLTNHCNAADSETSRHRQSRHKVKLLARKLAATKRLIDYRHCFLPLHEHENSEHAGWWINVATVTQLKMTKPPVP